MIRSLNCFLRIQTGNLPITSLVLRDATVLLFQLTLYSNLVFAQNCARYCAELLHRSDPIHHSLLDTKY